jgi:glycosyltransferase involved in cell wall biosynthesis
MLRSGGIGTYLRELLPRITQQLQLEKLGILIEREDDFSDLPASCKIESFVRPSKIYSLREQRDFLSLAGSKYELFWSPHFNVPWFRKPLLVTVHDTFHLSLPQFSTSVQRAYVRLAFAKIKRDATAIITVSEFSKSEVLKFISVPSSKVHVVPNGFSPPANSESGIAPREKPYVLFAGNLKPHKNLAVLVDAFNRLKEDYSGDLVVVGNDEGLRTKDLSLADYQRILGERLVFTGRVSDAELTSLYRNADVFVAPSLYEGFGLTPLEAQSFGCRVIASDIPAHREVLHSSVRYFDPRNPSQLSELMKAVLIEPKPAQEVVRPSLTWEKSAQAHLAVIESLGFRLTQGPRAL